MGWHYPFPVWIAFLLAGMGVGRLDLHMVRVQVLVTVVGIAVSALGYGLLEDASDGTIAFVQTFAAGAILTMLADTMMPEAYKHGGRLTGLIGTLGFATAYGIHLFE